MLNAFTQMLLIILPVVSFQQLEDSPKRIDSLPKPASDIRKEEAVRIYGAGLLYEKENRLLDAMKAFEKSLQLDPVALAPRKALIPIYLALDRLDDALNLTTYVLEHDPASVETSLLYARQLKSLGRLKEVAELLAKLSKQEALKDQQDLKSRVLHDLALLQEDLSEWKKAYETCTSLQTILDITGAEEILGLTPDELKREKAENYERLGRLSLKNGSTEQAVDFYLKAQKLDVIRSGRLGFNLAQVYASQGKLDDALLRVDEFLQTQPLGTDAYELKIDLQKKLNRNKDIIPELEQASVRDVHNNKLKLLLARELATSGNVIRAEAIFEKVVEVAPSPETYAAMFALYKKEPKLGARKALVRLDSGIQAANRKGGIPPEPGIALQVRAMLLALRKDPEFASQILNDSVRCIQQGDKLCYETCVALGTMASRMGNAHAGEQLLKVSLSEIKAHPDYESEVFAGLLRVLRLSNKYQDIIQVCKKGLESDRAGNRTLFLIEMAGACMHLQRDTEALAAVDLAITGSQGRENLFCQRYKANLLSQMGRHDEAVQIAQRILDTSSQPNEMRDARYTLSAIYSSMKQHKKSEDLLQAILEADPADATANNDLGYQWADRNFNLDQAEKLVRKALELDRKIRETSTQLVHEPENAAYLDSLGWVLFRQGRMEESLKELQKASMLPGGKDDPVVFDHMGDVYASLKEIAKARECWKKAVDLYEVVRARRPDDRLMEIRSKLKESAN